MTGFDWKLHFLARVIEVIECFLDQSINYL